MKFILKLILFLTLIKTGFSQTHQIALVKPDGTTTIHSTLQAAYDAAEDDDKIYLPGGTFTAPGIINKKIHIYGTGWDDESCQATGITIISPEVAIGHNASGGSITGFITTGGIPMYNVNNFKIEKVNIMAHIYCGTCENVVIINNIIGGSADLSIWGIITYSLIANNLIFSNCDGDYITFINNIFFEPNVQLPSNSTFENNIFKSGCSTSNSMFSNNTNVTIENNNNNIYINNLTESWPDIFVDPGPEPNDYNKENDYHVKTSSECHNSGTDGTDRGIYGGPFPWTPGSVPPNPHIISKTINRATDANGNLQINVNVRTGD